MSTRRSIRIAAGALALGAILTAGLMAQIATEPDPAGAVATEDVTFGIQSVPELVDAEQSLTDLLGEIQVEAEPGWTNLIGEDVVAEIAQAGGDPFGGGFGYGSAVPDPRAEPASPEAKVARELSIMARVLETRLNQTLKGEVVTASMFSRGVQSYYVPGVGAFFFINVKFGVAQPPQAEHGAEGQPREEDLWKKFEQHPEGAAGATPFDALVGEARMKSGKLDVLLSRSDPRKVERLKGLIFETFAQYGRRMESLGTNDRIIVVVNGGSFGAPVVMGMVDPGQIQQQVYTITRKIEQEVRPQVAKAMEQAREAVGKAREEAMKAIDRKAAEDPNFNADETRAKVEEGLRKAQEEVAKAQAEAQHAQAKANEEVAHAMQEVQVQIGHAQQEAAKAQDEAAHAHAEAAIALDMAPGAGEHKELDVLLKSADQVHSVKLGAAGPRSVMVIQFEKSALAENAAALAKKAQVTAYSY